MRFKSTGCLMNFNNQTENMIIETDNIPTYIGTSVLKVCCILAQEGPVNCTTLANRVGITTAGITVILDSGERAGLFKRSANPNDRRQWLAQLTEDGEELIARLQPLEV